MTTQNIIRAWKDPEYRNSLSASERALLPANPAGRLESTEAKSNPSALPITFILCSYTIHCLPW